VSSSAAKKGRVYFIGAGPGDPELLTIKARRIIRRADVIIYADSLVNPDVIKSRRRDARVHTSADLTLEEITAIILESVAQGQTVARLQSGDPAFYGAIREQTEALRAAGVTAEIIPGVSSLNAAAAALGVELTVPGLTQTVVVTRRKGRTPVPVREDLSALAAHGATMAIFLSVTGIAEISAELIDGGYTPATAAAVVYRVGYPDQKIITGNLSNIAAKVQEAGISRQALVLVGDALNTEKAKEKSFLYDKSFSHGYRGAR